PPLPHPTSSPLPYTTLFRSGHGPSIVRREHPVAELRQLGARERHRRHGTTQRLDVDAEPLASPALRLDVRRGVEGVVAAAHHVQDRKSTRLNSSHEWISYAV